jgi:hypothetical protein
MLTGCAADEDSLGSGIVGCNSSSKHSGLQTKKTKAISDKQCRRLMRIKGGNDSVRCSDDQANNKCAASGPEKNRPQVSDVCEHVWSNAAGATCLRFRFRTRRHFHIRLLFKTVSGVN